MTREEAIKTWLPIISMSIDNMPELKEALSMAIKALETVEEFEKAQIITGGRLNGRTYAYKCGLEDGKRKALEQEPATKNDSSATRKNSEKLESEWEHDHEILKAYSDGASAVCDKIRAEIEQLHLIGYATVDGRREIASRAVIQIIDKYKAGTEEVEDETN